MNHSNARRDFLVKGAAAASAFVAGQALGQSPEESMDLGKGKSKPTPKSERETHQHPASGDVADEYPRTHAGLGGPVGSPTDRGKLVPGLRAARRPLS